MAEQTGETAQVPADGFCPHCGALESEACVAPNGSMVRDHKARHAYPEDSDPDCTCGRDDRTNRHQFAPGCDAWDDDELVIRPGLSTPPSPPPSSDPEQADTTWPPPGAPVHDRAMAERAAVS